MEKTYPGLLLGLGWLGLFLGLGWLGLFLGLGWLGLFLGLGWLGLFLGRGLNCLLGFGNKIGGNRSGRSDNNGSSSRAAVVKADRLDLGRPCTWLLQ